MGVRESSGALAYTLGDGKYVGFHVELCQRIAGRHAKGSWAWPSWRSSTSPVTSQNRIPLVQNGTVDIECGSTTNNATRQKDVSFAVTTFVEEVRIAVKANSGITSIAQLNGKNGGHDHRHHLGADAAQARARHGRRLQGSVRQGPCRQLPAARIRPRRRLRDGRPDPGRQHRQVPRTRPTSRSSARCCRSSRSPS
ncbi:MAG: transporter substrate-binding domain-containing protein [Comamonadaceae bacterium]|nr:transporter substrate-binding domain-containing protein [Comamonadaceae bacterium]